MSEPTFIFIALVSAAVGYAVGLKVGYGQGMESDEAAQLWWEVWTSDRPNRPVRW